MTTPPNSEAIKVLLVEDNPGDARIIREILRDAVPDQFDLTLVECMAEAVAGLADVSIDVILLDLSLPDTTGMDTLATMQHAAHNLPIIVLTGNSDAMLGLQALREGAQDYLLKKNLDSNLLTRVLHHSVDRKRASEVQRESEERFRALVQHSTDVITILGVDGTVLYESPSLEKVMGYKPEAVQGLNITEVIHPDDMPSLVEGMMTILDQPAASFSAEVRLRHADGSWRTQETTMTNLLANPAIQGIVVNSRDITDRRQAEAQILNQTILLDQVSDSIIRLDLQGTIEFWNHGSETLYGWSAAEVIGKPISEVIETQVVNDTMENAHHKVLETGGWNGEYLQTRKDGTSVPVLNSTTLLRNDAGEHVGFVGINRDITDRKRANQTVVQSEKRLRDVLEILPVGVWIFDADGNITHANAAVHQIWAGAKFVRPEEFGIYKGWWVDTGKPLEAHDWAAARVFTQGETSLNEEIEIECFDGTHKFILNSALPLLDHEGKITGAITLNQDITERKQAERALRQYNQRLKILHSIDHGILTAQPSQKIAAMIAQALTDLIHCDAVRIITIGSDDNVEPYLVDYPPASESSQDLFHQAIKTYGLPSSFRQGEALLIDDVRVHPEIWTGFDAVFTAQGARSWIMVPLIAAEQLIGILALGSLIPFAFAPNHSEIAGEIASQLAIALHKSRLDTEIQENTNLLEARVTERTEQLHAAKERSEAIMMSASEAMIVVNMDGSVEQINPAFTALFGLTLAEVQSTGVAALVDAESLPTLRQLFAAIQRDHSPKRLEAVCVRGDGTVFTADAAFAPIADTQRSSVIWSLRDITDRKRAETELQQAWAKEKQLNALKSSFVSMVAHDFRTPLATIQSSSDLLRIYSQRMNDEKKEQHFQTIHLQIKHLTGLLEDTLTLTKADSVGMEFNPVATDVEMFCQALVDEMQMLAGTRTIQLIVENEMDWIRLDPKLLRRVLVNLLTNAVKYSPEGSAVDLRVAREADQMVLSIQDRGIGIPVAEQSRLFEVFHRAENVGDIPGTGLGLAIVKLAVEAHGGTITFESVVGVGSIFTVLLPVLGTESAVK